jgi:hypothetical protein
VSSDLHVTSSERDTSADPLRPQLAEPNDRGVRKEFGCDESGNQYHTSTVNNIAFNDDYDEIGVIGPMKSDELSYMALVPGNHNCENDCYAAQKM